MTAPAPVPDRSPSEAYLRRRLVGAGDMVEVQSGAVEAVLAELDRLRALIAAVKARCDEKEARSPHVVGGRLPAIIPVAEVRALIEGEKR